MSRGFRVLVETAKKSTDFLETHVVLIIFKIGDFAEIQSRQIHVIRDSLLS